MIAAPLVKISSTGLGVRENAAHIMQSAKYVRIVTDKIPSYTVWILEKYPIITVLDGNPHFVSEAAPQKTAAYVVALDSINFGSGYFGIAKSVGVDLEYDVIAKGLKKYFKEDRLNTPAKWQHVASADFHEMLNVPVGAHLSLDRLMTQFAEHLKMTGDVIVSSYNGDVMKLIESAGNSVLKLAETVAAWPHFHDAPFFKRAQIFAADINLALQKNYPDMDALTIFADNMVPHVLRCDGILEYAPDLAKRIDGGEMIAAGSVEEMELRAAAIHAVELMMASVSGVTSVNLDHILWHRGYEPDIYARPSHKTLSVWY